MNTIDNTNLLNMCRDCGAVGFVPRLSYVYDAEAGTIAITNTSTIPSGDTLKKIKVRVHDYFGGEVRGHIDNSGGGDGYITAPLVSFSGGAGSGATAHATIALGKVTGIVIDAAGTGYTSDPTVVFDNTGTGGSGAAATAHRTTTTVTSATLNADDDEVTLDISTLDASKQLVLTASIFTTNMIAADGGAYWLMAAGNVGHWDVQKNA